MLLALAVFSKSGSLAIGLSKTISWPEFAFWCWTLLFGVAELTEFSSYDLKGLKLYLRSGWNKIDVVTWASIFICYCLRMTCSKNTPLDELDALDTIEDQCAEEVYARSLYAIVLFLLFFKLLSYTEYNEHIGIHVIILSSTLVTDVFVFFIIMAVISIGGTYCKTASPPQASLKITMSSLGGILCCGSGAARL